MIMLAFLSQFAGATMLLLFAVRLVQTGVERAAGGGIKRRLAARSENHFASTATGVVVAAILQSATAVVLLVVGFYSAGSLGFAGGLAMILGADLGSAIAAQVLSLNLNWMSPFLIALGGWMFLKTDSFQLQQVGRILLGIGLILMALSLFRDILAPVSEIDGIVKFVSYLRQDILTAFLLGAILTLLMHSSLAVILILASAVSGELVPLSVGLSIMLGANFGSSLVPLVLTRGQRPQIKNLIRANAVLRGALASVLLVACDRLTSRFRNLFTPDPADCQAKFPGTYHLFR